jgi:hypothetical protein
MFERLRQLHQSCYKVDKPRVTVAALVLVTVLAAVIGSCSGNQSEEPTIGSNSTTLPGPTSTVEKIAQPTVSPSATSSIRSTTEPRESPAVIATVDGTTDIALESIAVDSLTLGSCIVASRSGSFGTAPAPTPTPSPKTNDSSGIPLAQQSAANLEILGAHLLRWSTEFEEVWLLTKSVEEEAAALLALEKRLLPLCAAVESIEFSENHSSILLGIVDALKIRHTWVTLAVSELKCCGTAHTDDLEIGRIGTHRYIEEVVSSMTAQFGSNDLVERIVTLDGLGLVVNLQDGWLLRDRGVSAELLAPVADQGSSLSGLGPASWGRGVATRIRKFKLPSASSLEEVVTRFSHVPTIHGEVAGEESSTVLGLDGHKWESVSDSGWVTYVLITHDNSYVYITEYGCSGVDIEACGRVENQLARITRSG